MMCHCGKAFTKRTAGEMATLVGFGLTPDGHRHDDNCLYRIYLCEDGHQTRVYRQRRCALCEWVGKARCDCHDGPKVTEWPDAEPLSKDETIYVFTHSR